MELAILHGNMHNSTKIFVDKIKNHFSTPNIQKSVFVQNCQLQPSGSKGAICPVQVCASLKTPVFGPVASFYGHKKVRCEIVKCENAKNSIRPMSPGDVPYIGKTKYHKICRIWTIYFP